MKRIFSIFTVLILLFIFSVGSYAEIGVYDRWFGDVIFDYIIGSNQLSDVVGATPDYVNTNGTSIAFFVSDGKACVSYFCASNKNDISVRVLFEKKTLGIFWVNVGEEKQETTDKKYLSGSCSVPVDGSGEYRVTVEFNAAGEKMRKTAVYEYDENILMGDTNSDGVITSNDARLILRFSARLQKYSNEQKKICDIDKNDLITAADARIVLRLSAKLI